MLTIACDIDGVLQPMDPLQTRHLSSLIKLPDVQHGTILTQHAADALREWQRVPGVRLLWHTTWRSPYTDDLTEALQMPPIDHFATDEQFLRPVPGFMWWKLAAVVHWLRHTATADDHLIWIDDDISDARENGEISDLVITDPRLHLISPSLELGLMPQDIGEIQQLIQLLA